MKLRAFNKEENKPNKKTYIPVTMAIVLGLFLVGGFTYSFFQTSEEGQFVNGTARYPKANEVEYTTEKNNNVHTVEDALNDLYEKIKN